MRSLSITICLAATYLGDVRAQQQQPAFPFARYPATVRFTGRPGPIDFASDTDARRFRTVLRAGARTGPNFAGAFTIVLWGCGTACRQLAIVSARTGAVYFAPFAVGYDVHYRRTSELLVVDSYTCALQDADLRGPRWRQLYRWNGTRLVHLDSHRVPSGHAC